MKRTPIEGSEIELETMYLQTVEELLQSLTTYLLHYESSSYVYRSEVKPLGVAVGKPSLNRAFSCMYADPKPE